MNDQTSSQEDPFAPTPACDQNDRDSGLQVDLSAFDEDFDKAEAVDFDELPDGRYQVKVDGVRMNQAKSSGRPMIQYDLLVISGKQTGRHIFKTSVITVASLPFVKRDVKTLGIELKRLSELPDRLDDILDVTLEVTKRTKGEFTNVYFNRKIDRPNAEMVKDDQAAGIESFQGMDGLDSIPF